MPASHHPSEDLKPATGVTVGNLLREQGLAFVQRLISDGMEETLHLEFKTLEDSSGERIVKDDRRTLAKAICGLSNAEGGALIVGVETKRIDNVDVAIGKRPIENAEKLRSLLTAAIPEMLSPQHPHILVSAISDSDSTGFVLIEVPRSDTRPHYSNVHHQYFRRGSDGTRVMEHSEIRELMFAIREGTLEIDWLVRSDMSSGDLKYGLSIVLALRNTSRVPVVAPYIRLANNRWRPMQNAPLNARTSAAGALGIYASRDVLVHVQDEIELAEAATGLDFRRTGLNQLRLAVEAVRQNGASSLAMAPFREMTPQAGLTRDQEIEAGGLFGGENVAAREFYIKIGKMVLFDRFCKLQGIN